MSESHGDQPENECQASGDVEAARVRLRRTATVVAALMFVVSIIPIPSTSDAGVGTGGFASGPAGVVFRHVPGWIGLTDPFHLVGYAVLAALIAGAVGTDRRGLAVAVALATSFGFGIELVQATLPWRTFGWTDVVINTVGAGTGAVFARVLARWRATGEQSTRSNGPST